MQPTKLTLSFGWSLLAYCLGWGENGTSMTRFTKLIKAWVFGCSHDRKLIVLGWVCFANEQF